MELRHLRYFVAVAEEEHFGRAAKRLHIAQPPLSRQIQDLEAELGFALFDRSRRRVELTAPGRVFLLQVRRTFDALDLAVREARRASRGEIGRVIVGYISSLAYSGIIELIRAFHAHLPSVDVTLRELSPQAQIEALKAERIDVGFVRGPLDDTVIASECMRSEPLLVALPAEHPLVRRKRIDLALLAREPFVLFPRERSPAFFDDIMALCRAAGFSPRIVQEAPHLDIISLVAAGFGVSILPESIRTIRRKGFLLRPIVGSPSTNLLIAWRADDRAPALAEFLAFARRVGLHETGAARRSR